MASADQAVAGSVWDLEWEGRSLFSVRLILPSEVDARGRLEANWGRLVALLITAGWLLALISTHRVALSALFGVGVLPAILLLLPLARLAVSGEVFSPAALLFPDPLSLTLGELLVLGGTGVFAVALVPWDRLARLPAYLTVPAAVLLASSALALLERGPAADLLEESGAVWLVFQTTAVTIVLVPFAAASLLGRSGRSVLYRRLRLAGSLTFGLLLCLAWTAFLERNPGSFHWAPWLWAIPLLGVTRAVSGLDGSGSRRPLGWPDPPLRHDGSPMGVEPPDGGPHGGGRGENRSVGYPTRSIRGISPPQRRRARCGPGFAWRTAGRGPLPGVE